MVVGNSFIRGGSGIWRVTRLPLDSHDHLVGGWGSHPFKKKYPFDIWKPKLAKLGSSPQVRTNKNDWNHHHHYLHSTKLAIAIARNSSDFWWYLPREKWGNCSLLLLMEENLAPVEFGQYSILCKVYIYIYIYIPGGAGFLPSTVYWFTGV